MPQTLDDDLYLRIQVGCAAGDAHAATGRFDEAIEAYREAWALLPEPRTAWDAALWIQTAIGDAHFLAGDVAEAKGDFLSAVLLGGAMNPFVQLRLGQTYFELGDKERAAEHLCRAYMADGRRVFEGEDPKYLGFLATVMRPPVGQDEL